MLHSENKHYKYFMFSVVNSHSNAALHGLLPWRSIIFIIAVCTCSFTFAGSAFAQGNEQQPHTVQIGDMATSASHDELLGLRIGTSARTARQLVELRGFKMRDYTNGLSWYGRVGELTSTNVDRAYRGSVTSARFDGPAGEQLELSFIQTPGGAALSKMQLQFPASTSQEALRTTFAARYGAPNCDKGWCAQLAAAPNGRGNGLLARITADPAARTITLDSPALSGLEDRSITDAARDCRLSRLGVPIDIPGQFMLAC